MPLYVRSEEVNDMAELLASLTHKSKTDAVKEALAEAIERARKVPSFGERIAELQAMVKADGFKAMPDQREFSDELSGGI